MSYPYFDSVQRAYDELRNEGLIGPRSNQDAIEQDKGLLTRRAAYYANQRDASHGLLAKTSGNNSMGYSVDWIVRNTDGTGWDIATDDGSQALPSNGGPEPADPARIPDWRQPTAELAQIEDGGIEPAPEPPPSSTDARLTAIENALNALVSLVAKQGDEIFHMRTQTWAGDMALAMRMHFGITCPPMPDDAASSTSSSLSTTPANFCSHCGQSL